MRARAPNSKPDSITLVRDPRAPPSAAEKAQRLKAREEDARLAWAEYLRQQQAVDENTARLKALRLARQKKAVG